MKQLASALKCKHAQKNRWTHSESKTATWKTKDDLDADSEARFGQHRNKNGSLKIGRNIKLVF